MENVIYLYRRKGNSEYATCSRPRYVEFSQHKLFETMIAYTSPPAPVAVVLPERRKPVCTGSIKDFTTFEEARGWNACLDKVKELNQ